jgi:hypothetical protein
MRPKPELLIRASMRRWQTFHVLGIDHTVEGIIGALLRFRLEMVIVPSYGGIFVTDFLDYMP